MTVGALTIDDVVVASGGTLTVSGATLTMQNTGVDVQSGGTVIIANAASSAISSATSTLTFENGSTNSVQLAGAAFPTATWGASSTARYEPGSAGSSIPTGLGGQFFGNFIWNWSAQNGSAILNDTLTNMAGNLELTSGSAICLGKKPDASTDIITVNVGGAIKVHTVSGNFLFGSGGTENGTYTIKMGNGIIVDSGGKLDMGNTHAAGNYVLLEFTGAGQYTLNGVGPGNAGYGAYQVDNGATVALNSGIAVTSPFAVTVNSGGTLNCGTRRSAGREHSR